MPLRFQVLGLKGNPLGSDVLALFSEVNGTRYLGGQALQSQLVKLFCEKSCK
jgi:hypothetical protein